jgi:hypothetical protein
VFLHLRKKLGRVRTADPVKVNDDIAKGGLSEALGVPEKQDAVAQELGKKWEFSP